MYAFLSVYSRFALFSWKQQQKQAVLVYVKVVLSVCMLNYVFIATFLHLIEHSLYEFTNTRLSLCVVYNVPCE